MLCNRVKDDVLILPMGPHDVRAVFHREIDDEGLARAVDAIRRALCWRDWSCAPSWRVLILWLLSGCSAPAILSVSREAKCYAQLSEARRATADNEAAR